MAMGAIINSLHATGLYIDHMNNSLAKKEKKRERKLPNRGTNSSMGGDQCQNSSKRFCVSAGII